MGHSYSVGLHRVASNIGIVSEKYVSDRTSDSSNLEDTYPTSAITKERTLRLVKLHLYSVAVSLVLEKAHGHAAGRNAIQSGSPELNLQS